MNINNMPVLYNFNTVGEANVKILLCNAFENICGVAVKEIGYGISPTGKNRILIRDAYMLQFITGGSGLYCGERFCKGDVLFSAPHKPENRKLAENESYSCAWITFVGEKSGKILTKCGIVESDSIKNHVFKCQRTEEAAKCIEKAVLESYSYNYEFELLCVLFNVLSMLDYNSNIIESSYIEKAKKYMLENFQKNIKISDVAKFVSLSQNYLCKLFVRECGHSIKNELTEIRLKNACELLKDTKISIRDIAYAVGFSDEKHFSNLFRKKLGISPIKYRQDNG